MNAKTAVEMEFRLAFSRWLDVEPDFPRVKAEYPDEDIYSVPHEVARELRGKMRAHRKYLEGVEK